MPELANVNGSIFPIEKAMIPVEDRGYQFGDAVYEVMASYNGKLCFVEAHLDRLEQSMKALSFPGFPREKIKIQALNFFDTAKLDRAVLYLQISRGVSPRAHVHTNTSGLQFVMTVRQVKEVPEDLRQRGARAITLQDFRWGRCDIKTVQLLANVMAKQKAINAGADDAIFISKKKVVREATGANLFMIANGRLMTHPLNFHVLPGVTRAQILSICSELDMPVEQTFFTTQALYTAQEVFLTGTTIEVLPVVMVDQRPIADRRPGPVTKKLYSALQDRIFKHLR